MFLDAIYKVYSNLLQGTYVRMKLKAAEEVWI